jgi:tetratricopeptide (TPR) repeat protein
LDLMGRPLEAAEKYKRAIDIDRAGQGEDVSAMLLADYSRVLEELGRLHEAADYASRAYSKARRASYPLAEADSLFELGRVAVAERKYSRAATLFNSVEPTMRKTFPPGFYGFAILNAQRALIALAGRDLDTAMTLASRAVSLDEAAIASGGDGAHDLPGLLSTRSSIELAASKPEAAASDAARAVALQQPKVKEGNYSSVLGIAYLALGRALQAQGKMEEAGRAFNSAAQNLQRTVGPDHPDARTARRLQATWEKTIRQE